MALLPRHATQGLEGGGDASLVSELSTQRQSLLELRRRESVLALQKGQYASRGERLRPQGRRRILAFGERLLQPLPALAVMAAQVAEPPQRLGQSQANLRLPAFEGPAESRSQVVEFRLQPIQPSSLSRARELGLRLLRETHK